MNLMAMFYTHAGVYQYLTDFICVDTDYNYTDIVTQVH